MKKLLALSMMLLVGINLYAQDIIVKRDGTTIMAKVLTVGTTVVEYKKWTNQDGPTYSIEKSELLSINYANGEKDVFEAPATETTSAAEPTIPEPVPVVSTIVEEPQPKVNIYTQHPDYRPGKGIGKIISGAIIGGMIGIPMLAGGTVLAVNGEDAGAYVGGVGGALIAFGFGLMGNGIKDRKYVHRLREQYGLSLIHYDFKVGDYTLTPSIDMYTNHITKEKGFGAGLAFRF